MLFRTIISIIYFAILTIHADEFGPAQGTRASNVCYGEYGCFTTAGPFAGGTQERPFAMLPQEPSKVGTVFYLYTRATRKNREVISRSTNLGVWTPSKPTKFMVHGFFDSTNNKQWWLDMKNALLAVDDVNVILVDWSKGNGFPYTRATANTQIVAAEISLLIEHMIASRGSKPADFHVIGHSLGSHIAGFVGTRVRGLGRISGLDPAGPYFENTDPIVRLDPTDAEFVDVIHTDGSPNLLAGLGTLQRMGHVDFYPNGGYDQPKCPKVVGKLLNLIFQLGTMNVEGFTMTTVCSHMAAVYFYTDTMRHTCPYTGFSCSNFDQFNTGRCSLKCDGDDVQCNRMGYWASPNRGGGKLYLKTQDANAFPFCINHYQITLESGKENKKIQGSVTLKLIGTRETVKVNFDDGATTFTGGSAETRFVPLTVDIGEVQSIEIDFKKTVNLITLLLYSPTWSFTKATIFNADNQDSRTFCSTDSIGTPDSTVRYSAC